ncbi:signal peptidase I [Ideonella sp. B7]|uniref:signal peptidase I n=1 Tax=Ideonella benzenivorans TaxID=2831643 RepID=UPI001CEDDFCF|nr:signal peptidase I [Ideonella benzenivorans]MCA6216814.1 signal peptidase I [Ideonella benzenivorans]
MSALTAVLYGALIVYLGGWYLDLWFGNFALLLLILSVVTGIYWVAEKWRFQPRREAAARTLEAQDAARRAELSKLGIDKVDGDIAAAREQLLRQPWWLDWTAGLFPVIIVVFVMRSFLFEPFKIPSGSMIPTLQIGDLILVNKFHYGIRLPVIDKKIIPNQDLARGDVVVFRYPVDPRLDYIKRVVGLPGDEVSYLNAQLKINGQPVPTQALGDAYDDESMRYMAQFSEKLGPVEHAIQRRPQVLPFNVDAPRQFPFRENCRYSIEGFVCKVPAGHYFMMGDNRDNSEDSRYWGFVPDENIVGKAVFVWMNFRNPSRIGSFH